MYMVTVSYGQVTGKAKSYPYYQPALYKATFIKSRNHWAWVKIAHLGRARRSEKLAHEDAKNEAKSRNCKLGYARQYVKLKEEYVIEMDKSKPDIGMELNISNQKLINQNLQLTEMYMRLK